MHLTKRDSREVLFPIDTISPALVANTKHLAPSDTEKASVARTAALWVVDGINFLTFIGDRNTLMGLIAEYLRRWDSCAATVYR